MKNLSLSLGLSLGSGVWAVDPGLSLLNSATSWYSAKDDNSGSIANRNGAGAATVSGARWLQHTGADRVWFPSAGRNYLLSSDSAASVALGVTTLAARVEVSDSLSGTSYLMGADSNFLGLALVGRKLRVSRYDTANAVQLGNVVASSDLPTGLGPVWVRGSVDLTTGLCSYGYSTENVDTYAEVTTWTSLGTDLAGAGAAGGTTVVAHVQRIVGSVSTIVNSGSPRSVYAAQFIFDGVEDTAFVADSLTGWAVNQSASGYKTTVVDRFQYALDGVDDRITFTDTGTVYTAYDIGSGFTFDTGTVNPQTAGNIEGAVYDIVEFASPLTADELAAVSATLEAGTYD